MMNNWLKILSKHFDKHKIQGRIFFGEIGLAVILFAILCGIYTGEAIYDYITSTNYYK